jgi:hypothetical protein
MQERRKPTNVPSRRELKIRVYCSYMKTLKPSALVRPILLRQPYSQTFSLMLVVVLTRSKKKDSVREMAPTTRTMMLKTVIAA